MSNILIVLGADERLISDEKWAFYKAKGYRKVDEVMAEREAAKKAAEKATVEKPLAKMNKDELTAKATELNIEVPAGATNKEIVTLLETAIAANESK